MGMGKAWLPRVVTIACSATEPAGSFGFHSHDFDEFCLVEGETTMGHADKQVTTSGTHLFLFRQGERHAYWNSAKQDPRLWVVHFRADPHLYQDCPSLAAGDPAKRIWKLAPAETQQFKNFFIKVANEHQRHGPGSEAAESAWLRLLLVAVQRWSGRQRRVAETPEAYDKELVQLWQTVNDHAGRPAELARSLSRVPNYDSLRHRFRAAFGVSPSQLMRQMRMEHAKTLLLETAMSVGEIAEAVGYGRQHEFTRAFHRHVGRSPSRWRQFLDFTAK